MNKILVVDKTSMAYQTPAEALTMDRASTARNVSMDRRSYCNGRSHDDEHTMSTETNTTMLASTSTATDKLHDEHRLSVDDGHSDSDRHNDGGGHDERLCNGHGGSDDNGHNDDDEHHYDDKEHNDGNGHGNRHGDSDDNRHNYSDRHSDDDDNKHNYGDRNNHSDRHTTLATNMTMMMDIALVTNTQPRHQTRPR